MPRLPPVTVDRQNALMQAGFTITYHPPLHGAPHVYRSVAGAGLVCEHLHRSSKAAWTCANRRAVRAYQRQVKTGFHNVHS